MQFGAEKNKTKFYTESKLKKKGLNVDPTNIFTGKSNPSRPVHFKKLYQNENLLKFT